MTDLESLCGTRLLEPSESFLAAVEARVAPVLRKRRRVRVVRNTSVLTLMALISTWATLEFTGASKWLYSGFSRSPKMSGSLIFMPITVVVEQCDLMIQGVVEKVDVSREGQATRLGDAPPYATITFRIVDSYPPISDQTVAVSGSGSLEVGAQYLIPLNRVEDHYVHQWSFGIPGGDYLIEQNESRPVVRRFFADQSALPLERAWEIIRKTYDRTHGVKPSDPEAAERHREALKHGTFDEAEQALELLAMYGQGVLTETDLVEAIEAQHAALLADNPVVVDDRHPTRRLPPERAAAFRRFALHALELLIPLASEDTAKRVVDLYLSDMAVSNACAFGQNDFESLILKLAVKHPGPDRSRRLHALLGRRFDYMGTHGRYGGVTVMRPNYFVMRILAETPGEDIDAVIEEVYADPGRFHLEGTSLDIVMKGRDELRQLREGAVHQKTADPDARLKENMLVYAQRYEQGGARLHLNILLRIRPGDKSAVPFLLKANPAEIAPIIRWKVPDPAFAPMLREAVGDKSVLKNMGIALYPVLSALRSCGEEQAALERARGLLSAPIDAEDWRGFAEDASARCSALLFLGEAGDPSDVALFKRYTEPVPVKANRRTLKNLYAKAEGDSHFFPPPAGYDAVDEMYQTALLARTRIHDPSVVTELQALYTGEHVGWRITAATAFFYLGDDTGAPMIESFRRHAELADPVLAAHFGTSGATGELQKAIAYLRSPKTDALFLERLRHGFGNGDHDLVCNGAFLLEHAAEVIPLLKSYLEDRNIASRRDAKYSIELIAGIDVPWDDAAVASGNAEAVARLRAEADSLLAQWAFVPTGGSSADRQDTAPQP